MPPVSSSWMLPWSAVAGSAAAGGCGCFLYSAAGRPVSHVDGLWIGRLPWLEAAGAVVDDSTPEREATPAGSRLLLLYKETVDACETISPHMLGAINHV